MSGGITLRFVDPAELNSSVQRLADAAGSTAKEVLPSQMRLFAADLAFNTRPIGKSSSIQNDAKERVGGRIGETYASVGAIANALGKKEDRLSKAFLSYVRKREFHKALSLANRVLSYNYIGISDFDGGDLHRKQKFARKVHNRLIVLNYPKVTAYIKEKKKLVGFAKGGFATAARQLGGVRGIPGFATRQKSPGTGRVTGGGNHLTVTMTNNVRYIEDALDSAGEDRAIAHRKKAIEAVIKRIMRRKTRSASRSIR